MMNEAKIMRWSRVLSELAHTRWRILEVLLKIPCVLVMIFGYVMTILMLATLGSIFLGAIKHILFGTDVPANLAEVAYSVCAATLIFVFVTFLGHVSLELVRALRLAVYAILALVLLPFIRRDFTSPNISWLALARLMAIDCITKQQSKDYECFAAMTLTHQLDRDKLPDYERTRIDEEIEGLQLDIFYQPRKKRAREKRALNEFDRWAMMQRIERVYERLQGFGEQSYRASGVRINTSHLYSGFDPFERLEIGGTVPTRRRA